nr:hypothetical protein [Buchnera aphidicola]
MSLHSYNIFIHRYTPKILEHLGILIIFISNLGSFSRGIITTITYKLQSNVKSVDIYNIFYKFYGTKLLIRLYDKSLPNIKIV